MSTATETIEGLVQQEYKYGFVTDVEADTIPRGLSEDTIRQISARKGEPEWLLEWRLKAYRHWQTMTEPTWPPVLAPTACMSRKLNLLYFSPSFWTTRAAMG